MFIWYLSINRRDTGDIEKAIRPENIYPFQDDLYKKVTYALDDYLSAFSSLGFRVRICGCTGGQPCPYPAGCSRHRACLSTDQGKRSNGLDRADFVCVDIL